MGKTKLELQMEFCESQKLPFFAVETCPKCRKRFDDLFTAEQAKTKHINGCPKCHYSWCD